MSTTKKYLDKNGLDYLVGKIKNEYHKVKINKVSSGSYPVVLGATSGITGGKAYETNIKDTFLYDAGTNTMSVGKIKTTNAADQASNKYFATDGTIQSISTSSDTVNGLPYNISIPTYDTAEQNYLLDTDTFSFAITNNGVTTDNVFTMSSINPHISCKTDLTSEQLTQKYKNCFLCHLVQRRSGNFVYWRIVDSTFETYPLWLPKKLTGGKETLQFGYVRDLMNQACKFTNVDVNDALIKCMFFGSQNDEPYSWHQAGALKNFINYGSDDRYIQLRGMKRTLNERNRMREDATQRVEVNAENILRQYSNGYSINVKIAIFGTADTAITNNTTDAILLSNVINGKYYIKKVTKSPKSFVFGFAEEL